jgi:hypothetical protein
VLSPVVAALNVAPLQSCQNSASARLTTVYAHPARHSHTRSRGAFAQLCCDENLAGALIPPKRSRLALVEARAMEYGSMIYAAVRLAISSPGGDVGAMDLMAYKYAAFVVGLGGGKYRSQ